MAKISNKKRTIRNLVFFTIIVWGMAWGGWLLYRMGGRTAESQSLGLLLFILSPITACLLLRLFGGGGWKDMGFSPRLRKQWRWYLFAIIIYPISIGLTLTIGAISGGISFTASKGITIFLQLVLAAFGSSFLKNILEEFGWRAFLAPKIFSIGLPNISAHLISGLIWALWHIPYYLGLLDQATMHGYTTLPLTTFLPLVIIGITVAAIAHNEIRLITNSVWPAVVLHSMSNAIILVLLIDGFITIKPGADSIFSPGLHSLVSIIFSLIIGIGLLRYRKRH